MDLRIYPNPGIDLLQVNWNARHDENVSIIVTDIAGRVVSMNSYEVLDGQNLVMFDMSSEPSGVYLVQMHSNTIQETLKWIKIED
jgi:hypothetical protein